MSLIFFLRFTLALARGASPPPPLSALLCTRPALEPYTSSVLCGVRYGELILPSPHEARLVGNN